MPSYQKVVVLDSKDTDWCMQTADVSHQLQRESANQKQEWVYQLLCRAL